MKTVALSLLILFMAVVAHAQNWYEPVPCYACDVDTSYSRQNDWDKHMEEVQSGFASNYGLGPNNGTSFGGSAPHGEWQHEYSPSYDPNYSWEGPRQNYQPMIQEQPDNYSYGIPGYDKRLDSCGPYYNKRARAGC